MVSELVPVGATKGVAVATFMREPPFAGRAPVVVGDDVTDEDAFVTANELGGVSIHVGGFAETSARYALANVAAVRAWLAAAL
jgi:trehalose 6-phosphate phosphatase